MKKIKLFLMTTLALLLTGLFASAQGTDPVTGTEMFAAFFASLGTLAAINPIVTGWISTHVTGGKCVQVLSWVVAIALSYAAWGMKWGMFANFDAVWTGLFGLGAGLVSNGIADIKWVQAALEAIAARTKK